MSTNTTMPELVPGLFMLKDRASWTGARSRRTGYAMRLTEAGVLALIDPPPLAPEEYEELERLGSPTHIVLTCNWHLRGAEALRQRWECPLLVHEAGLATAETTIDGIFRHGERLWDAVEVLHLPAFGWPEEAAFLVQFPSPECAPCSALIVGDAICGGRDDVGVPKGEVGMYTMEFLADRAVARRALEHLLTYLFDVLAFGHGEPVLKEPHTALRRFLAREDLWGAGPPDQEEHRE